MSVSVIPFSLVALIASIILLLGPEMQFFKWLSRIWYHVSFSVWQVPSERDCTQTFAAGTRRHLFLHVLFPRHSIGALCTQHGWVHQQGVYQQCGSDFASGLTQGWIGMVTVFVVWIHHPILTVQCPPPPIKVDSGKRSRRVMEGRGLVYRM